MTTPQELYAIAQGIQDNLVYNWPPCEPVDADNITMEDLKKKLEMLRYVTDPYYIGQGMRG